MPNVTLIPKGPPSSSASNYRPISLTPILSKVFERLVSVHLGHFMECRVCFQPPSSLIGKVLALVMPYFVWHTLSCKDNEYSLVVLLGFIDSQDYRYRTIKYMNCNDMNKWSTDIVAIIPSFVESKKGLFQVAAV